MTLVIRFLLVASLLLTQDIHAFEYHYPCSSVDMQLRQVSHHVLFMQGATGVATDNQGCINPASIYTVFRVQEWAGSRRGAQARVIPMASAATLNRFILEATNRPLKISRLTQSSWR